MYIRVGQDYKINEEITVRITEIKDNYIHFAEFKNGKYKTNRVMKRDSFLTAI